MENKPCPFCGKTETLQIVFAHEASEYEFNEEDRAVCCNFLKGGCGAHGGYKGNEKDAVSLWNTRPEPVDREWYEDSYGNTWYKTCREGGPCDN